MNDDKLNIIVETLEDAAYTLKAWKGSDRNSQAFNSDLREIKKNLMEVLKQIDESERKYLK